jgi:hypothetical protein
LINSCESNTAGIVHFQTKGYKPPDSGNQNSKERERKRRKNRLKANAGFFELTHTKTGKKHERIKTF